MSKPIKAILCGAGDMARKHIEAYRKLDNVEIAAVASRSIPRAAALLSWLFFAPVIVGVLLRR